MKRLGWNTKLGKWTVCTAKTMGSHGCVHTGGHIDHVSKDTLDALTEELQEYAHRNSAKSGVLSSKPKMNYQESKNTISNFGDAAEISANLDIILGRAEFDESMPYQQSDVAFIEIRGQDKHLKGWTIQLYQNGDMDGPYPGDHYQIPMSDLEQHADAIREELNVAHDLKQIKAESHLIGKKKVGGRLRVDSTRTADQKAEDDQYKASLRQRGRDIRSAALQSITSEGKQISKLLHIPDDRQIKSLGEKADVRIGIKSSNSQMIDRVSTKSFLGGSNAQLFSAGGSVAGEVRLVSMLPDRLKNNPEEAQKVVDTANNYGTDEQGRIEYLKDQGFTFNEQNAMIMNQDYATSIDHMGKQRGVDAKAGLIGAAVARVNHHTTKLQDLDDTTRAGFVAVCLLRGSTEYNPNTGVYTDATPTITTYADVTDRTGYRDGHDARTILSHRSLDEQADHIVEYGSLASSNSKNLKGQKASSLSQVHLDGDVITYPVNLGLTLKSDIDANKTNRGALTHTQKIAREAYMKEQHGLEVQSDEFTCSECFLVKHRNQLAFTGPNGPVCKDCA
jgi:hypothetical protein